MPLNQMTPDCPNCGAWITKVILTKFDDECANVVRRRHCEYCGHRFYTKQHHEELVEVKWVNGKKGKATIPRVTKVLPTPFKGQVSEPLPVRVKGAA
jgi:transcriptional regulator NrdR family protein